MASQGNQHCASCIGTLSFPAGAASIRFGPATRISYSMADILSEGLFTAHKLN